jgi:hypothetical protein
MTFSLNGGWMFAAVALLWVMVYVPNWGAKKEEQKQGSSFGRKFSKNRSTEVKNAANGVSHLAIFNKNIRSIRRVFSAILFASFAVAVAGVALSFGNIAWLTMSVIALAVFLLSASTLRSSRQKSQPTAVLTIDQLEAQRARMAYSIREASLRDAKTEQLFDERAWSANALPDSTLSRRMGELEDVTLAEVLPLVESQSRSDVKKLDPDELDRILKRRRAI